MPTAKRGGDDRALHEHAGRVPAAPCRRKPRTMTIAEHGGQQTASADGDDLGSEGQDVAALLGERGEQQQPRRAPRRRGEHLAGLAHGDERRSSSRRGDARRSGRCSSRPARQTATRSSSDGNGHAGERHAGTATAASGRRACATHDDAPAATTRSRSRPRARQRRRVCRSTARRSARAGTATIDDRRRAMMPTAEVRPPRPRGSPGLRHRALARRKVCDGSRCWRLARRRSRRGCSPRAAARLVAPPCRRSMPRAPADHRHRPIAVLVAEDSSFWAPPARPSCPTPARRTGGRCRRPRAAGRRRTRRSRGVPRPTSSRSKPTPESVTIARTRVSSSVIVTSASVDAGVPAHVLEALAEGEQEGVEHVARQQHLAAAVPARPRGPSGRSAA